MKHSNSGIVALHPCSCSRRSTNIVSTGKHNRPNPHWISGRISSCSQEWLRRCAKFSGTLPAYATLKIPRQYLHSNRCFFLKKTVKTVLFHSVKGGNPAGYGIPRPQRVLRTRHYIHPHLRDLLLPPHSEDDVVEFLPDLGAIAEADFSFNLKKL